VIDTAIQNQNEQNIKAAKQQGLPMQVYLQNVAADEEYKVWLAKRERENFEKSTLGRPRNQIKYKKPIVFFGDNKELLELKLKLLNQVIGPRAVGNNRYSRIQLYSELLDIFIDLKIRGIRLPKGGSLSAQAVRFGLGDFLIEYSYTSHSIQHLVKDSSERIRVGKSLKSIFKRVADVVYENV
jgi:hypothetical protein